MKQWPWLIGGPKHGERVLVSRYENWIYEVAVAEPMVWVNCLEEFEQIPIRVGIQRVAYFPHIFMYPTDWKVPWSSPIEPYKVWIFEHHPIRTYKDAEKWTLHWPNISLCECAHKGEK